MGCGSSGRDVSKPDSHEVSAPIKRNLVLPEISIYFGSQSGNSERFAKELLKEAQERYKFTVTLSGLENFDLAVFKQQTCAIFVVSTYGEGGPTDNAQKFYEWLINANENFSQLRFTIFGCGDSSFSNTFNRMAKTTEANLLKCGALEFHEAGFGDDSKNLLDDFNSWKENLWQKFISFYKNEQGIIDSQGDNLGQSYVSSFKLEYETNLSTKIPADRKSVV